LRRAHLERRGGVVRVATRREKGKGIGRKGGYLISLFQIQGP